MEALTNALINADGLGVLSAALLWLQANAISAFREELKTERRLFIAAERRNHASLRGAAAES